MTSGILNLLKNIKFNKRVIESEEPLPYSGDGRLINSQELNNLNVDEAFKNIENVEDNHAGKELINTD